jgi:hypothetical protein
VVRATRAVDVILAPESENLKHLRALIANWHATRPDGSPLREDAVAPGRTIHLSTPRGELDLLAELPPPLSKRLQTDDRSAKVVTSRNSANRHFRTFERVLGPF